MKILTKDDKAIRFAGLMEDYLNIPSFVCEMIQQQLEENKYKEVVEYVVQRRNEIESKPEFISDRNAITMLVNQNETKDKEIERLNNIINTMLDFNFFKEECPLNFGYTEKCDEEKAQDVFYENDYCEENCNDDYKKCWLKYFERLQELKGSNEPSFEEMVGFVENVYKDIKSQSTLHEELEEERKTIAKIVGDFKEINK